MSERGNTLRHITRCLIQAVKHPRMALLGASEFRTDFTTSYDNYALTESYDSGRELAHILTFRHYDQTRH